MQASIRAELKKFREEWHEERKNLIDKINHLEEKVDQVRVLTFLYHFLFFVEFNFHFL